MAQQATYGEHIALDDPFDQSIYVAFDLVLNHDLNPWNIDLVSFSSLYLQRARREKIDLLVAGRIIYMAWKVLRMQSDNLVVDMEAKKQEFIEPGFGWDDLPMGAWLDTSDGYSYTNIVMRTPQPPLQEPIRRESERKVTLIELLDAFNVARKEAENYQILDKIRREERERLKEKARKAMKGTAHEDHLEEDIAVVWERIQCMQQKSIRFTDLCNSKDQDERTKVFLSILFLAYEKKISVSQRRFPYGEILIKHLGYT